MMGVRFPGLAGGTWLAADQKRKALEGWLFGAKHATYGLSLLRILYGLLITGLLAVNFAERQYIWGVGSRWLQPLVAEKGFTWPFTLFSGNSPGLFTATYLLMGLLALLFTLGWRTRLVTPVLLVLWVSLTQQNPLGTDAGDVVVRLVLLYVCFADLSAHWSLDARRRTRAAARPGRARKICQVPARNGRTCSTTQRLSPWPAKSSSSTSRRPCLRSRVVCGRTEPLSTTQCTCICSTLTQR